MKRGGGGVAAASPLTNPHIPTPNQPTPFNLTPHFKRPLEPHSLPPFLPPYPSPPTMIPVQSFTGGAAGHKWGCWSRVGLLVTGGAAGHGWGCWSQVGLLVIGGAAGYRWGCWSQVGLLVTELVPGAGVTAVVLVLVIGCASGAWCWRDGAGAGAWCWRDGAGAGHSAATPFPLSLSPPQRSAANSFPSSLSHPQRPPLHTRTVATGREGGGDRQGAGGMRWVERGVRREENGTGGEKGRDDHHRRRPLHS
ncbi:unnamed protein product [Closterium sp. NIES-65]|nr:unnamed protein product [Closterium sp. NIES-65]